MDCSKYEMSHKVYEKKLRFPVEFFDLVQFFLKDYNDHQLHCIIYFKNKLDIKCIKQAVLLSMDVFPILRSRFVVEKTPYYEFIDVLNDDIVTYIQSDSVEKEIDKFITTRIDITGKPQLLVRIIGNDCKDILCVIINHMICDASGFKEYLYVLSAIYTNLKKDSHYKPLHTTNLRNLAQIYKKFSIIDRLKMIFMSCSMPKNKDSKNDKLIFPFSNQGRITPFIVTYKLQSNRFLELKKYSKIHDVTINDIILAGFIRTLYIMLDIKDRFVSIPCPGFNMIVKIDIIFKLLPYSLLKKLFKKVFRNATVTMTNIGIIDKDKLIFDDVKIKDAFITPAIRYKYPPSFQMAVSTFNDCMTYSISLYGSESDKKKINEFFNIFDSEIPI